MAEYIEREALLNSRYWEELKNEFDAARAKIIIISIPSADVVEVVHGEWKFNKDGSGTCNQCGITQKNVWDYDNCQNYCGHCGARMDGDSNG